MLAKLEAVGEIFNKYDEDGSSKYSLTFIDSLDVFELGSMFKQYKIDISTDQLKTLFNIVDKSCSGELTLD